MPEMNTEFFSIAPDGTARGNTAEVVDEKELSLEGVNGNKMLVELKNPNNESERRMEFYAKEYVSEDEAKKTVALFSQLRGEGFPVPPTVRYFERDGKHFVLMTDMTEGGKYDVWTNSGGSFLQQEAASEKLRKINPTMEEVVPLIDDLCQRLTEKGYKITGDAYALRRVGGVLQMFLLDVSNSETPRVVSEQKIFERINTIHKDSFKSRMSRILGKQ